MKKVSINTAVFLDELQRGINQLKCLEKVSGKPIANIEVRGEFFKEESLENEIMSISELCNANDWGLYFSIPDELFNLGGINTEIYKYIDLAEKFNITGLKISLGKLTTLKKQDLNNFREYTKGSSTLITVENQPNTNGLVNTVLGSLRQLKDELPEIGYTFDSGNWYWNNEKPEHAIKELINYIDVFHLKDIRDLQTVMLGNGESNWKSMIASLKLNCPVFLEYAISDNDLDDEIRKVNSVL